jgi:hypothetical protein
MPRHLEITHEERLAGDVATLPKRLQRYRVRVSAVTDIATEPSPLADQWDNDSGEYVPLLHEVRVSVDPTEFLDYLTLAEVLEYDKENGLLTDGTDAQTAEMLARLGAVDEYEVIALLDEIRDALATRRIDDALRAMDAFEHPKFASLAECKAALAAAGVTV